LGWDKFVRAFGRPAEGCWAAPGRVNLIGEYTDVNDGHVLPFAISRVTRVWAGRRADRRLGLSSGQDGATLDVAIDDGSPVAGWVAYPRGVALALQGRGHPVGGADLLVDSDVPIGAGLSSSAALECSVGLALSSLYGFELAPLEMAQVAQQAENDYVGVPCGIMDQAASMCARGGHALLIDTRSLATEHLPFDLAVAGLSLIVFETGVKHDLVGSGYANRRRACAEAARLLGVGALRDVPAEDVDEVVERLGRSGEPTLARRARHVLTEEARVLSVAALLRQRRLREVGPLLTKGHESLRDDFEVSCAELDTVVEAAITAGALGARLTGAGFGGSAIVLVEEAAVGAVTDAVEAGYRARGWPPPRRLTVVPSDGAHREA